MNEANPFAAPQTPPGQVPSEKRRLLRLHAFAVGAVMFNMFWMLAMCALRGFQSPFGTIGDPPQWGVRPIILLLQLFGVYCVIFAAVAVRRLGSELYGRGMANLLSALSLIPGIGLVTLSVINRASARRLKTVGVNTNWLGSNIRREDVI